MYSGDEPMAVAVYREGMNHHGKDALHPFFTLNRSRPTTPLLQEPPPKLPQESRSHCAEDAQQLPDNVSRRLPENRLAEIGLGSLADQDGGFDLNEKRKKRQKHAHANLYLSQQSPVVLSWREELIEAAGKVKDDTAINLVDAVEAKELTQDLLGYNTKNAQSEAGNEKSTADDQQNFIDQSEDELAQCSYISHGEDDVGQSQKKMIKIRPDGRLVSPGARVGKVSRTKRRKDSSLPRTAKSRRIVKLIYGTDEDSRHRIGKKITAILGSLSTKSTIEGPKIKAVAVNPKLEGPPKPTHPFFLPKIKLKHGFEDSSVNDSERTKIHNEDLLHEKIDERPPRAEVDTPRRSVWSQSRTRPAAPSKSPQALWPPRNMVHLRNLQDGHIHGHRASPLHTLTRKKLKNSEILVHEEDDVLNPSRLLVKSLSNISRSDLHLETQPSLFDRPVRRLLTPAELQAAVGHRLEQAVCVNESQNGSSGPHVHPAIEESFHNLATASSAFERFQCETEDWNRKYAPKSLRAVLQPSDRLAPLRDWLKGWTIHAVENSLSSTSTKQNSLFPNSGVKRRKRKAPSGELDDFIVSGDEGGLDSSLTDSEDENSKSPRLFHSRGAPNILAPEVPRLRKLSSGTLLRTRSVVISGPSGCGKTAAIYALANELGFEIFEINAGTRRTGRDIMDKVGDMARNHLVNHNAIADDVSSIQVDESLVNEPNGQPGEQPSLQSFFTKAAPVKKRRGRPSKVTESPKKPKSQKQSLILLEEVDILFEEDKPFWNTVINLIASSKRPIVMTCRDEDYLPTEELMSCSALRLQEIPEGLGTDYLLLLAAAEGHLLTRPAVNSLYRLYKSDLRAAINQLNFWCQMAIGSTKSGLDWMLMSSDAEAISNAHKGYVRVVSEGSFTTNTGTVSRRLPSESADETRNADILLETLENWSADFEDWNDFLEEVPGTLSAEKPSQLSTAIKTCELAYDALSAADVMPAFGLFGVETELLDTPISDADLGEKGDYLEGMQVLAGKALQDQHRLSENIIMSLRVSARNLIFQGHGYTPPSWSTALVCGKILNHPPNLETDKNITKAAIQFAFEPIAAGNPSLHSRASQNSICDVYDPSLAVDVAPYIRSIVSYDIQLESQRLALSNLISQGGRGGKRQRKTRSSLAALEGGSKADTRRERWFPEKLNFAMVLKTGGDSWQDLDQQKHAAGTEDSASGVNSSRRSSLASSLNHDQ